MFNDDPSPYAADEPAADQEDRQPWAELRETTVAQLELHLAELDERAAGDDVLLWLDRAEAFAAAARAVREAACRLAVGWIAANGPLRLNANVCYTVGHTRTVRCLDVRGTLHVALSCLGGDLDAVAGLLASSAWKHGACRSALPEAEYDRLFLTEVKARLVRGGSEPEPKLIRVDGRFARRRQG